jgi:hypothetical protein
LEISSIDMHKRRIVLAVSSVLFLVTIGAVLADLRQYVGMVRLPCLEAGRKGEGWRS